MTSYLDDFVLTYTHKCIKNSFTSALGGTKNEEKEENASRATVEINLGNSLILRSVLLYKYKSINVFSQIYNRLI